MASDSDSFELRARARRAWPIRRYDLGSEPSDDLSASTTVEERLNMMWQLTLDAWASTGTPLPTYRRADAPGRVVMSPSDDDADAQ